MNKCFLLAHNNTHLCFQRCSQKRLQYNATLDYANSKQQWRTSSGFAFVTYTSTISHTTNKITIVWQRVWPKCS